MGESYKFDNIVWIPMNVIPTFPLNYNLDKGHKR